MIWIHQKLNEAFLNMFSNLIRTIENQKSMIYIFKHKRLNLDLKKKILNRNNKCV